MIRNTHAKNSEGTISAYSDNAAVLQGEAATFWSADTLTNPFPRPMAAGRFPRPDNRLERENMRYKRIYL